MEELFHTKLVIYLLLYMKLFFITMYIIIIIIINDIYKAQASPNAAVAPKSVVACTE